jgi:hypothetical protein
LWLIPSWLTDTTGLWANWFCFGMTPNWNPPINQLIILTTTVTNAVLTLNQDGVTIAAGT